MSRRLKNDLPDLAVFSQIVEAGSFTKAAGRMGMSQSALSHAIRRLEDRVGVRVLNRSSRSMTLTEAGRSLAETIKPAFREIESELDALTNFLNRPSGKIRISSATHPAVKLLWPKMLALLEENPGIGLEVDVEDRMLDIVSEGFDAGIRLGQDVAADMIAVPIGPTEEPVVVASPNYLNRHGVPEVPRDLVGRECILRALPTLGGVHPWHFRRGDEAVAARVSGRLTLNSEEMLIDAAISGAGLAYVLKSQISEALADGRLVPVLSEWCAPMPGFHLYYPMRRHQTSAFKMLVAALRHQEI